MSIQKNVKIDTNWKNSMIPIETTIRSSVWLISTTSQSCASLKMIYIIKYIRTWSPIQPPIEGRGFKKNRFESVVCLKISTKSEEHELVLKNLEKLERDPSNREMKTK